MDKYIYWMLFGILALVPCDSWANSSGTGFFISTDGLLVTNFHVIEGATEIRVKMPNGEFRPASSITIDRANDLAILQVQDIKHQAHLILRHSAAMARGADVFTVGFPLVSIQGAEPKVTNGIVSSLTGFADEPTMFQVSVPLQAGNSGGPLVAMDGSVVGVVSAKLDAIKVQRATGDIPQNVSYAIKSAYLLEMLSARAIVGRVRTASGPLLPLVLADAVRKVEPAVVLILASSQGGASAVPAAPAPPPSEAPPPASKARANIFGGVSFELVDGYLEVSSVARRTEKFRTTLRLGDRLLECATYARPRIYAVDDIKNCQGTQSPVKVSADTYMIKVLRLGEQIVASIILVQ